MINSRGIGRGEYLEGIIVKGIAGFYYVKSGDAVYRCKARGVFKQRDIKPAVGDRVVMEVIPDNDDSLITDILPRKNSFIRPFVANVDCFAIVAAAASPDPVMTVIDRFLVMAEKADTDIVFCVNKCDLAAGQKGSKGRKAHMNIENLIDIYKPLYPLVCLDGKTGEGTDELLSLIKGKKTALAGPSGVGKSAVLNRLVPEAGAETGRISEKSQRGRHTTRHSELFSVNDGKDTMIFDTPGFTSFNVLEAEEAELQYLFPEISSRLGGCRYKNCVHISEPGCAIVEAVRESKINESRYRSYIDMIEEIRKSKQY